MDVEFARWVVEFGQADAEALLGLAERGLPDYEYLKKQK